MLPEEQINLYGYKNDLDKFYNYYNNGSLPKKILLTGNEGIGKCTFAYHFINIILSKNTEDQYNLDKNVININSKSFKLVKNNSHPNFFKISLNDEKNSIDITQIRDMIQFSRKTSFDNNEKIILIDKIEHLNSNSANALLKILEDLNDKIIFILIHSKGKKIIKTIKSRCIEFTLSLNNEFLSNIINSFFKKEVYESINNEFKKYYFSPKFYIDLINISNEFKFDFKNNGIESFLELLINNKIYLKKNYSHIDFKIFIEIYFYNKTLYSKNIDYVNYFSYFNNRYSEFKKYNLDLESFFIELNRKILNV